jgi:hypothetical protein
MGQTLRTQRLFDSSEVSQTNQTAITLLLPFRRYRLRFSHRLLESLGGVSRFVLRALADGLSFNQIAEVTALSHSTLLQQFTFLAQHHFVSIEQGKQDDSPAATLLERGVTMVRVERYLKEGEHVIWLDAFTVKRHAAHLLVPIDASQLVQTPEDASGLDSVVCMPQRPRAYHLFDEVSRLRGLLGHDELAQLLEYFWPGADTLIADEIDSWDYGLSQESSDALDYYPLTLERGELLDFSHPVNHENGATLPAMLIPVLGMKLEFSTVDGFPWRVAVPPPRTWHIDLITHRPMPHFAPDLEADATRDGAVLVPAAIGTEAPDIGETVVPPGLSAKFTAAHAYARRDFDHQALTMRMHGSEDVILVSFNQRKAETEAA